MEFGAKQRVEMEDGTLLALSRQETLIEKGVESEMWFLVRCCSKRWLLLTQQSNATETHQNEGRLLFPAAPQSSSSWLISPKSSSSSSSPSSPSWAPVTNRDPPPSTV